MSFELFVFSHAHNGISNAPYAFFGEVLECYFAIVAVEVHTIIFKSIAMGWESVVGTAGIVASTLTGIFAHEHTTCIDNLFG